MCSKVLSVGDDCMMKVFTAEGGDGTLVEETLIDLEGETFALSSNQVDRIAYGGPDGKVYLEKVSVSEDQGIIRDEPFLAMSFNSCIQKVQFVGGKHLLGVAEDSQV